MLIRYKEKGKVLYLYKVLYELSGLRPSRVLWSCIFSSGSFHGHVTMEVVTHAWDSLSIKPRKGTLSLFPLFLALEINKIDSQ